MNLRVGQCFERKNSFEHMKWIVTILHIHGDYVFVENRIKRKDHNDRIDIDCATIWKNDFLRNHEYRGIMNVKRKESV